MELMGTLGLDVSGFVQGKDRAKAGLTELESASREAGGQIGYTAEQINATNSMLNQFAANAGAAGLALSAGFTIPIVGLASEALNLASSFQQATIGFTTMMGSATAAGQFLSELRDFAASSPFEFPDLQRAATRLQAMGFAATAVIPIMTGIGDAVAGLGGGQELINRITTALGQMNAKGKVSAEEMNQLAEAGINAWGALAQSLSVSIPRAMEMAKAGMITSTQAIPAILEGMQSQFGGMMANQMATLAGQWSNFKDQLSFILADIGTALLPFGAMVLQIATPILGMLRDMATGFAGLPGPIQTGAVAFAGLLAAIGPLLLVFAGFTSAVAAVGTALGVAGLGAILTTVAPAIIGITAAVVAASYAFEQWQLGPVQESVRGLAATMMGFWNDTLKPIVDTVLAAGLAFSTFASDLISSGLQAAWEGLVAIGGALWDGLQAIGTALSPLGQAFMALLDALSPLLVPIGSLIGFLAEMAAALVAGGLIAAWEALKTVFGFVADVALTLANIIGSTLMAALNATVGVVSSLANSLASTLKPVIEKVTEKITEFLGALANIPGVKQALEALGLAFGTMKTAVVGAMDESKAKIAAMGSETVTSMKAAKDAFEDAKNKAAEVATKYRDGKASSEELKRANENLVTAQRNYNSELDRAKPKIDAVMKSVRDARTEYDAAERNVKALELAQRNGNATAQQVTDAQIRLKTAADNLKTATAAMKDVTDQTGVTMKDYQGGIDSVRKSLADKATATGTAENATKQLKKAVDEAKESYRLTYEQYTRGLKTEQDVADSQAKLQAAFDALHPERVAERQAKGHEDMMKRYNDELKWFQDNIPKFEALNTQWEQSNTKLAVAFGREHDKIANKAKEQLIIDIKITERLPQEVQNALAQMKLVEDAYKGLGITSTATFKTKAEQAAIWYEQIKNSGVASARDILAAEKAALDAKVLAQKTAGEAVGAEDLARQKQLEQQLDLHVGNQKTKWQTLKDDLTAIGRNLNRDMAGALVDLFEGKGWDGFKDAGIRALESIGMKIAEIAIEYVEKKLAKAFLNLIDGPLNALGSKIGGLFGIGGGGSSGGGGGGGSAPGGIGSIAGGAGGEEGGAPGSLLPPVFSAFMEIAAWLQGRHMEADIAKMEVTMRELKTDFHGPFMDRVNMYYPKLDTANFDYNVLIPTLTDITEEVRGKSMELWRELINVKNEIINVKDFFHDLIFAQNDGNSAVAESNLWLERILNATYEVRGSQDDTRNAMPGLFTNLTNGLSGIGGVVANAIGPQITGLSTYFTNIANAIRDTDSRNSITAGFSNLQSSIANLNSTNALTTGFSNLQSSIMSLSSGLGSLRQSSNYTTQTTQTTIVNINGVNSQQGIAGALRSVGVPF